MDIGKIVNHGRRELLESLHLYYFISHWTFTFLSITRRNRDGNVKSLCVVPINWHKYVRICIFGLYNRRKAALRILETILLVTALPTGRGHPLHRSSPSPSPYIHKLRPCPRVTRGRESGCWLNDSKSPQLLEEVNIPGGFWADKQEGGKVLMERWQLHSKLKITTMSSIHAFLFIDEETEA